MSSQEERYIKAGLEHNHISRRGLFRSLVSGAKTTTEHIENPRFQRLHPRPPTCVDEELLARLCDSCGDCADHCDVRVLKIIDGKPQLHLDCNYCTDCGACAKVCKTGALSNNSHSTGVIPAFGDHCQRLRFGHCEACKSSCDKHAIEMNGKRPTVNQTLCNGCGECRSYCPMNAISFDLVLIG